MTTPSEPTQSEAIYLLGDNGAEMARLIEQDRHFTTAMGGLLPEQPDLSKFHRILDVACGPGGWVLELAQAYPTMQVFGADISSHMINYATAQARASGLDNASFSVMNILESLDFPDDSFDLVNARFMAGFMPKAAWPRLIHECLRITRRGGVIRLTENEWGVTNSPAFEKLFGITAQTMQRAGQLLAPDWRHVGITPMQARFLRDAGCINIQEMAHSIDFSTDTEAHMGIYQDLSIAFKLMQPFQVAMGVATQQELDQAHHNLAMELLSDEFCGLMLFLTTWGEKPEEGSSTHDHTN